MAHFPAPPLSPNNQRSPSRESGSPRSPPSSTRCCDTGRPLFTDPITGHTVCSCQYHDMLAYQRLPALYPAPYPPEVAAYFPAAAAAAAASLPDQPPFYPAGVGLDVKDGLPSTAPGWPYPSVYHPYDAAFAGYPFNGYGMDLNGARRKNATRETTSTLKAWLNEHKKNPYPTKGEKIMLAIITKMTLTQVSTWFANARRRLKKENKMTWEPRNRVDEEDNNNEESPPPRTKDETKDNLDSKDSGTASSEDGERTSGSRLEAGGGDTPGTESWSESRPDSPECLFLQPGYPRYSPPAPKPRIWSLADMAKPDSPHRRPQRAFPYPPVPPGLYSRVSAAHSSGSVAAVVAAAAAAAASAGGFPSSSSQEQKPETRA